MADFLAALDAGVLLGDGAMGTELFRRGVPRDHCLPELNLSRPDLVQAIHEDYARAGARVHRTNTFTANDVRLEPFGLAGRVHEVNRAAVEIARRAAGPDGFVAGCVGSVPGDPSVQRWTYQKQIAALREAGVDLLLFETFTAARELSVAVSAARAFSVPVAASVAIPDRDRAVESLCDALSLGAGLAGMNCVSAEDSGRALRGVAGPNRTFAFPSPGLPGQVASPEEFARSCEPLVGLGVRILGGCCGAGPEHVRALAAILRRPRPSA